MRRQYIDGPFGQIHLREWAPAGASRGSVFCFHPSPFSGASFDLIAPHLANHRRIVAPDYPGYGGSSRTDGAPTIDDYAEAMGAVIDASDNAGPIALLGFHTGCLVVAEVARRAPNAISKLCLIDVPAFPPDTSAEMAAKFGAPPEITAEIDCLSGPWKAGFLARYENHSIDRALEMFAEQVRAGMGVNAAFRAAFTYPWSERFIDVKTETMVLATTSSLLDGSRTASQMIPGAILHERLDITRSVLDDHAETIAADISAFLSGTGP